MKRQLQRGVTAQSNSSTRLRWISRLGVAAILVCTIAQSGKACCGVSPGEAVTFGGQTNIILWDEAEGVEHFIRNASFSSNAPAMGFLAPTPTVPELATADPNVFQAFRTPPIPHSWLIAAYRNSGGSSSAVNVLQVKTVGPYRATTIQADDAKAMSEWLSTNGFKMTPEVERWLARYVYDEWCITAFVVANPDGAPQTGAIRMSFKTDRPFNPYYVPKSNWSTTGNSGGLQLYFASTKAHLPRFLPAASSLRLTWNRTYPFSRLNKVRELAGLPRKFGDMVVHSYFDPDFPGPANTRDIFFVPATPDQVRDFQRWRTAGSIEMLMR